MAVYLVPEVRCDGCGRHLVGHQNDSTDTLVDAALDSGWQTGGGLHTCTTCSAPIDLIPNTTSQEG